MKLGRITPGAKKRENIPVKAGSLSPESGIAFCIVSDPNGVDIGIFEQKNLEI
jgi:hypothetical protein